MTSAPTAKENGAKPDSDLFSRTHLRIALALLSTLIGVYLCYLIALPFLPALAWAIGLSVLATPLQTWLEAKLGHPGLCALACTFLLGLVVVVPTTLSIQQLLLQAASGATLVEQMIESGELRQNFSSHPNLASALEQIEMRLDLPGNAKLVATTISDVTVSIVKGSIYQIINLGLTFYLLFFLLRDRTLILNALCQHSPLSSAQMAGMIRRVNDTIAATVYGSFVVAAIQGTLLGLTFWILGLPAPFLWGAIMAGLALAPIAGAILVWGPAAFFLVAEGSWGKAIWLVILGVFVVVVVDNLLRPVLVGKRVHAHTVLVFMSVVGGMLVFGPSGILVGPIVLTVTQVLLEVNNANSIATSPDMNRN